MVTAFGFIGATTIKLIERGLGYVVRTWSDPLFWGLMSAGLSFFALIIWAIPAARLSTERITTVAYPFRVSWNEIQRVKVSNLLRLIWLRVYGPKSRFAIWVPLPENQIQDIYTFMQKHGGNIVTAAFSDKRLN